MLQEAQGEERHEEVQALPRAKETDLFAEDELPETEGQTAEAMPEEIQVGIQVQETEREEEEDVCEETKMLANERQKTTPVSRQGEESTAGAQMQATERAQKETVHSQTEVLETKGQEKNTVSDHHDSTKQVCEAEGQEEEVLPPASQVSQAQGKIQKAVCHETEDQERPAALCEKGRGREEVLRPESEVFETQGPGEEAVPQEGQGAKSLRGTQRQEKKTVCQEADLSQTEGEIQANVPPKDQVQNRASQVSASER